MYKGIEKNQNYTWLICAAQNMKNIAMKKTNIEENKYNLLKSNKIFIKIVNLLKYIVEYCRKQKLTFLNVGVYLRSEQIFYLLHKL
ncbi:MAG: hypothetical protein ACI4VL_01270 [Bacilli bacterium]